MPVHVHADEEELFVVLGGEGLSWQDGKVHAVGAGDVILHRAGAEAHTIVGAGDGLDVLAFGSGSDTGLTWLPRAGAFWAGPHWIPHDGPAPFDAEAGRLDAERLQPRSRRRAAATSGPCPIRWRRRARRARLPRRRSCAPRRRRGAG